MPKSFTHWVCHFTSCALTAGSSVLKSGKSLKESFWSLPDTTSSSLRIISPNFVSYPAWLTTISTIIRIPRFNVWNSSFVPSVGFSFVKSLAQYPWYAALYGTSSFPVSVTVTPGIFSTIGVIQIVLIPKSSK